MSAESKLKMVWSALENDESALNDIFTSDDCQPSASSRSKARGEFRLQANTTLSQKNVPNTAMKLWNAVGTTLKSCQKKSSAKREITKIVSSFPIVQSLDRLISFLISHYSILLLVTILYYYPSNPQLIMFSNICPKMLDIS